VWSAALAVVALGAAACGSDAATSATTTGTGGASTTVPVTTGSTATGSTTPGSTATTPGSTTPGTEPTNVNTVFSELGPPTGEPIPVGLVNTEGTPGLDFPELRIDIEASVEYLNQHGGMGGRPIALQTCKVDGSPETSQSCAEELVGGHVELVLLGLDLFPAYDTYTAADIPVIGVLPILPGDYSANALFLTGGNATTMAAAAAVAKDHFAAQTVAIVSADNAGANSSEASLTASLDLAGIAHTTVKGGDTETDAGYQGLMRAATKDHPDLLVSLYSDDGCIGTMRARASLGITIPVITTGICASASVLEQVGDDAAGWTFIGVSTPNDSAELRILQEIMAPVLGVSPDEVDSTSLGLGGLGIFEVMSLAVFANMIADSGNPVTGASLYDFLGTETDLTLWPGGAKIDCGASAKYPAICSFTFPFAEYTAGSGVATIPGLEAVSALDYLP
jgi:branched-chain amino acid transport system substrate-binding protein